MTSPTILRTALFILLMTSIVAGKDKTPPTYQKLEGAQAAAMLRLLDVIEDLDDTQNVYSNFDMDEEAVTA